MSMLRMLPLATALLAVVASSAPAADEVADPAQMKALLDQIRQADNVSAAASAYAKACNLDRRGPQPRIVYLKKLLQLGRPTTALFPARSLESLGHDVPLAHAVIAYDLADKRQYAKALEEAVLSLAQMAKDPGMQSNVGQLKAWGEAQKPSVKLSARAREVWREKGSAASASGPYRKGYSRVSEFYEKRKKIAAEFDGKINALEGKHQALRKELKAIDAQCAKINGQIRGLTSEYYRLKRELARRRDANNDKKNGNRGLSRSEERRLEDRIDEVHAKRRRLQREVDSTKRQNAPKLVEYNRQKNQLAKLNRDKQKAMGGLEKVFAWRPPGVDGVVTPASDKPIGATTPAKAPDISEAARKLKLAKAYKATGRETTAITLLQQIMKIHPDSPEAKEARKMILDMATE